MASAFVVKSNDYLQSVYERSNLTRDQFFVWVTQELRPKSPLYNIAAAFTFRCELNPQHVSNAFQTLVNSTDALRTTIVQKDRVPRQSVVDHIEYPIEFLDFSSFSDAEARLQTWLHESSQKLFNLEERLFESVLIKVGEDHFVWYVKLHHLIADCWTMLLLLEQLTELYRCSVNGHLSQVINLPSFQDYVSEERSSYCCWPTTFDTKTEQGMRTIDPVIFYGKVPNRRNLRVHRISSSLGSVRTKQLKAHSSGHHTNSYGINQSTVAILLAALSLYIYRASGNKTVLVGVPFHNRRTHAHKNTVGLFVKVLPVKVELEKNETFSSLVRKVKRQCVKALRNASSGIDKTFYSDPYNVILNYLHHTSRYAPNFDGKPIECDWIHTGEGNNTLALHVQDFDKSGSLTFDFDFNVDIFDQKKQTRMIRQYFETLEDFLLEAHHERFLHNLAY